MISRPILMNSVAPVYLLIALATPLVAGERLVSDPESARKAVREAAPGDVVVLAAGEWRDADLRLEGEGTEDRPIVIRAESPGETILVGDSRVRLGGRHLELRGIWLRDLSAAKGDWMEFRIDSKRRALRCRVSDCAFTESTGAASAKENRWLGIYGEGNAVERCLFEGKKNKGATVVVWLGEDDPGGHRIVANRFGGRPQLGGNGGETIRIGDSATSTQQADCLVEGNLFLRCDGETECVSNKSCGNVYRGNFFVETQGTLTLRHGEDCLVEGNVFLGRERSRTGGIRVIGKGHRVVGNRLEGLRGDGFRAALCLVNGIPDSPANGYHQVVGTEIRDNLLLDCKDSVVVGYNDVEAAILAPREIGFSNNRIRPAKDGLAVRFVSEATGVSWKDNLHSGRIEGFAPVEGLRQVDPRELGEAPVAPPDPASFGPPWWRK
jgi:poly(beta-D-mannuronate) lyase